MKGKETKSTQNKIIDRKFERRSQKGIEKEQTRQQKGKFEKKITKDRKNAEKGRQRSGKSQKLSAIPYHKSLDPNMSSPLDCRT